MTKIYLPALSWNDIAYWGSILDHPNQDSPLTSKGFIDLGKIASCSQ